MGSDVFIREIETQTLGCNSGQERSNADRRVMRRSGWREEITLSEIDAGSLAGGGVA